MKRLHRWAANQQVKARPANGRAVSPLRLADRWWDSRHWGIRRGTKRQVWKHGTATTRCAAAPDIAGARDRRLRVRGRQEIFVTG